MNSTKLFFKRKISMWKKRDEITFHYGLHLITDYTLDE